MKVLLITFLIWNQHNYFWGEVYLYVLMVFLLHVRKRITSSLRSKRRWWNQIRIHKTKRKWIELNFFKLNYDIDHVIWSRHWVFSTEFDSIMVNTFVTTAKLWLKLSAKPINYWKKNSSLSLDIMSCRQIRILKIMSLRINIRNILTYEHVCVVLEAMTPIWISYAKS